MSLAAVDASSNVKALALVGTITLSDIPKDILSMTSFQSATNVTSNAVIPSTIEGAAGFIERLLRMLGRYRFTHEEIVAIRAAVEEGLKNAIIHGNKSKPEKQVHAIFTMGPTEFSIRIQDEGQGFDPNRVAGQSGQGLLLMRRSMDAVRFNGKGNIVTLVLRRRSVANRNCANTQHREVS